KMFEGAERRLGLAPAADDEGGGGQGVERLEFADERQIDVDHAAVMADGELLPRVVGPPLEKADVARIMADADEAMAARPAETFEIGAEGIVHVDDRDPARRQELPEEPRLGEEVVLDRGMVIHVVAG